jgi:hypothetical protein
LFEIHSFFAKQRSKPHRKNTRTVRRGRSLSATALRRWEEPNHPVSQCGQTASGPALRSQEREWRQSRLRMLPAAEECFSSLCSAR